MNREEIENKLKEIVVTSLDLEDITATVDFTGAEVGTATFKVTIRCKEEYPNVGAVGTYSVSAIIQEK